MKSLELKVPPLLLVAVFMILMWGGIGWVAWSWLFRDDQLSPVSASGSLWWVDCSVGCDFIQKRSYDS